MTEKIASAKFYRKPNHVRALQEDNSMVGFTPFQVVKVIHRGLLICCRDQQDGILVNSDGYSYARYAAYIPRRSALELKDIEYARPQSKHRRSGPER